MVASNVRLASMTRSGGRTVYGSGRKLAQDFQLKLTLDKRAGEKTFPDYGKSGKANFGDAAEAFISHMAVGQHTKETYLSTYRNHVKPVFGDRTLAQVASDRDGVKELCRWGSGGSRTRCVGRPG